MEPRQSKLLDRDDLIVESRDGDRSEPAYGDRKVGLILSLRWIDPQMIQIGKRSGLAWVNEPGDFAVCTATYDVLVDTAEETDG